MKKTFLTIVSILCVAFGHAQDTALMMVHFGTTYDDTRAKTIDAINDLARTSSPLVREAYTSRIVIKRLAQRGINKPTPIDALLQLRAEGYRNVVVQPTYIIDGIEMDRLRDDIRQVRPFFDSIRISTPLLYTVEDCKQVCSVLTQRHPANAKKREHVLFVGHGTEGPATALYSQLDHIFCDQGHPNYHVATIEGYPTLDTAISQLKEQHAKHVTLVPLLFVAGDHANNDIAHDWKERLQQEGFTVDVRIEGLGEVPEIQALYLQKLNR